jgi:NADPH:quinone reductase-like Zn-dependent oxidoreductase
VLVRGKGGPWLNGLGRSIRGQVLSPFYSQSIRIFFSFPNNEDLVDLKELVESGKVTLVIETTYPLSETPEALAYVVEGHTQGKTVITV